RGFGLLTWRESLASIREWLVNAQLECLDGPSFASGQPKAPSAYQILISFFKDPRRMRCPHAEASTHPEPLRRAQMRSRPAGWKLGPARDRGPWRVGWTWVLIGWRGTHNPSVLFPCAATRAHRPQDTVSGILPRHSIPTEATLSGQALPNSGWPPCRAPAARGAPWRAAL